MNRTRFRILIIGHEGLRYKAYTDTVGKVTVGVGRNLTDVGLGSKEVELLLDNDITRVWRECVINFDFFGSLDEVRQHVLMDMCFNIGISGLHLFRKMLKALSARNFDRAATEMLDSKWAKQVGEGRSGTLANMMRTGIA